MSNKSVDKYGKITIFIFALYKTTPQNTHHHQLLEFLHETYKNKSFEIQIIYNKIFDRLTFISLV